MLILMKKEETFEKLTRKYYENLKKKIIPLNIFAEILKKIEVIFEENFM